MWMFITNKPHIHESIIGMFAENGIDALCDFFAKQFGSSPRSQGSTSLPLDPDLTQTSSFDLVLLQRSEA